MPELVLTENQLIELKQALLFEAELAHRTSGYNTLMLLARLARYLGLSLQYVAATPATEDHAGQVQQILVIVPDYIRITKDIVRA